MPRHSGPLLVLEVGASLLAARDCGASEWIGSLDLGRSLTTASPGADCWSWHGQQFPYPAKLKERTIYCWDGDAFVAVSRFS